MKSKSGDGLLGFLKRSKGGFKVGIILAVGLLLVILGTVGLSGGSNEEQSVGEEERLTELCGRIAGVGECRVMLTYRDDGSGVASAAVVCRGADSAEVRRALTELITSLYGIGSNRVSISKMKNG